MGTTYYLITQQLGKLIACVESGKRTGKVLLCPAPDVGAPIEFTFDPATIALQWQSTESVEEIAVRIAVAQARRSRLFAAVPHLVNGQAKVLLNVLLTPWRGDLTREPYGGATLGIEQRSQNWQRGNWSEPDRRVDAVRADAVEKALRLLERQMREEAEGLLARHDVPDHVVLRVASCAAFRRKAA